MPEMIRDGAGSGRLARVSPTNRIEVQATTHSEEHEVSTKNGESFFINTADTANMLTSTATGGEMLFIKNTSSTKKLVIEKVFLNSDTAGQIFIFMKNGVVGTIGNNNIHAPVNLNFGSNNAAMATAYNWNEVGDGMTGITGGTIINVYSIGANVQVMPLDGAIILDLNNSFSVQSIGDAEIALGMRFYFDILK